MIVNQQGGGGLMAYPIGSYYWSSDNTSPASLFGGTWETISGKFLLSASDAHWAGATGGEETHSLTVAELPQVHASFAIHGQEHGTIFYRLNGYASGTVISNKY